MAQKAGHWEKFENAAHREEVYSEGPFVMVNANGWRIECEGKGIDLPTLPHTSVETLLKQNGFDPQKTDNEADAARKIDWLNAQVKAGKIVQEDDGWWIAK